MGYQEEQIEASVIYKYICKFSEFEAAIKKIFSETVMRSDRRTLLYYYYGALQANKGYIDYSNHTWAKPELGRYRDEETFLGFTLLQLIRIDKIEHFVEQFRISLQSENTEMVQIPFHDVCIKLISMRNKIAHESNELSFSAEDIVEIMPLSRIKDEQSSFLSGFDLNRMSTNAIQVYSNLHVIDRIMGLLGGKQDADKS